MKTKGITIWERHAEKIVVALAVAAAVALTALQFMGEPNAVKSGAESIAPSRIDEVLETKARELLTKLGDEAAPGVEFPDPVGAADDLIRAIREPAGPKGPLPQVYVAIAPKLEGLPGGGVDVEFPVPELKAAFDVATGQTFDALDPGEVEKVAGLKAFFPDPEKPYDVIYATAVARYSLADLRAEFRGKSDAPSAEAAVIPSSWYNDRPDNIVDVVVERQELVGETWSDGKVIEPLPGRISFRTQLAGKPDAGLRDIVLSRLTEPAVRTEIIQPAFYKTRNDSWELPIADEAAEGQPAGAGEDDRVAVLRKRLKELKEKEEDLLKRLEARGGRMDDKDEGGKVPPGGPGGGGTGGGGAGGDPGSGAGGGSSGGGGGKKPPGKRDAPGKGTGTGGFGMEGGGEIGPGKGGETGREDSPAITSLKKQIRLVREQIAATEEEQNTLIPRGGAVAEAAGDEAAAEPDDVLIWAHDMTVVPGHTYRYRLTVSVYNPFFVRKRSLVPAQAHLAESFVINSAPSEWSAPMRVNPPLRVFITSATPAGMALGSFSLGQVRAEVYRFYDGTQWMEPFTVEPGQHLGAPVARKRPDGAPVEIDFSTGLFVLDIVEDIGFEGTRSAKVLLQDARTGEILELKDPDAETGHPERERLQERVEAG